MIKWFRNRRKAAAVFVALALVTLVNAGGLTAGECTALDMNDLPRECTFLERTGGCMAAAADSFMQCVDGYDGDSKFGQAWHTTKCQIAAVADQGACAFEAPFGQIMT